MSGDSKIIFQICSENELFERKFCSIFKLYPLHWNKKDLHTIQLASTKHLKECFHKSSYNLCSSFATYTFETIKLL